MNEYAKELALKDQGFQLGESGPLRTGKTVPTVYKQPQAQALLAGNKTPLLTTSGKPLPNIPQSGVGNIPIQGQTAYVLPNGQVTSNPELVKYAEQAIKNGEALKFKAGQIGKGFGGPVGWGAMLLPEWYNSVKSLWNGMNLDTMDPETRNAILKAAGKEDKIANYAKQQSTVEDLNMPQLAKAIAKWMNGNPSDKSNNGKGADDLLKEAAKNKGQEASGTGKVTGGAAPAQQTAQQIADQLAAAQLIQGQLQGQGPSRDQLNEDLLNQYIAQMQRVNKPYIDSLTNYYKNYDEMLKRNQAYKRYWQGISSITGNPNWAKIADAYNPIVNEANKVGLVKQLQDARNADLNAINEAMGNLAAVREMDMDPATAFANKNLLTMMSANNKRLTDWEKALLMADVKRYGFDTGYKKALDTQRLRNEGSANVANINAAAYGYGGGVAPGLNQQGVLNTQQKLDSLYR